MLFRSENVRSLPVAEVENKDYLPVGLTDNNATVDLWGLSDW